MSRCDNFLDKREPALDNSNTEEAKIYQKLESPVIDVSRSLIKNGGKK